MIKLVKVEWASRPPIATNQHLAIIRELMSFHCLCSSCCHLFTDVETGKVQEDTKNSALHWSRVFEWPWVILNGDLESTHDVLDAGGGWAVLQYALSRRCRTVTNLDCLASSLKAVDLMAYRLGFQNIKTQEGSIADIPYQDNSFDRVVCVSVVEHVSDWRKCIDEMFRVLKPGGYLLLTMDVASKATSDFCIDLTIADAFLREFNSSLPFSNVALGNIMPCGTLLNCLCMMFEKEK